MASKPGNAFLVHQKRSLYAPTLGAVVIVGLPSDFDNPVFRAKLRSHPSYLECSSFPDVDGVDALEEFQADVFQLAPTGREDQFTALTLKVATAEKLDPTRREGQLELPTQRKGSIVDLLADIAAQLPSLELWAEYAAGGTLKTLRVPPAVYKQATDKYGNLPFLSECPLPEGVVL